MVAEIGLVGVGLIATKLRHGHFSLAIGMVFAAAGLLAVGAVGGGVTAGATGGLFQEPTVRDATGQTRFELQAGIVPFIAMNDGKPNVARSRMATPLHRSRHWSSANLGSARCVRR